MTLRVPPPGAKPVFILWLDIDLDAFLELSAAYEQADCYVVNSFDEGPADEIPLRDHLQTVAQAQVIVVPDTWWTSVAGLQLVQVAGWLGMEFHDYEGTPIATLSLKAMRG